VSSFVLREASKPSYVVAKPRVRFKEIQPSEEEVEPFGKQGLAHSEVRTGHYRHTVRLMVKEPGASENVLTRKMALNYKPKNNKRLDQFVIGRVAFSQARASLEQH
jgi:hypothetical protein